LPLLHYGSERQRARDGETGRERVLLVEFRLASWWDGSKEVGETLWEATHHKGITIHLCKVKNGL